jgi:hypothetical protein
MHAQAVLQRDARRAAGLPPLPVPDAPGPSTVSPRPIEEDSLMESSDPQTASFKNASPTIDLTVDSPPKSSAVIDLVSPTLNTVTTLASTAQPAVITAADQPMLSSVVAPSARPSLALRADVLEPELFGNVLSEQDAAPIAPQPLPVASSSGPSAAVPTAPAPTDEPMSADFLAFLNLPTPSSAFPTNAANTPTQQPQTTTNTPYSSAQAPNTTLASVAAALAATTPVTTATIGAGMAEFAGLFNTSLNNNGNHLDVAGGATPVDFAALLASLPSDPAAAVLGSGGVDNDNGYGSPVGDVGLGSGLDLEEFLKSLGGGEGQ